MSGKLLQVNFNYKVSRAEYEAAVAPYAEDIASVPGLKWKVWIMDEEKSEAGGIYYFENKKALQAYLNGPIVAWIMSHPALENISAKVFDTMDDLTAITRGPIEAFAHP